MHKLLSTGLYLGEKSELASTSCIRRRHSQHCARAAAGCGSFENQLQPGIHCTVACCVLACRHEHGQGCCVSFGMCHGTCAPCTLQYWVAVCYVLQPYHAAKRLQACLECLGTGSSVSVLGACDHQFEAVANRMLLPVHGRMLADLKSCTHVARVIDHC